MSAIRSRTAFVPHDLEAPIKGASTGPLAGLTAAIKDMYDIKGTKSGGGNPDWLKHAKVATSNARRPSGMDFSCGFQSSRPSGTRSSARRVRTPSRCSSSENNSVSFIPTPANTRC